MISIFRQNRQKIFSFGLLVSFFVLAITYNNNLYADAKDRADSHAPIGVMADHVHDAGELMLSYRYMLMNMESNYVGSDEVDVKKDILLPNGEFVTSPTKMTMEMHMLGAMYAPAQWLTLALMVPYLVNKMDHQITNSVASNPMVGRDTFATESAGLGDVRLSALFPLLSGDVNALIGGLGIKFPTGSISEEDEVPVPPPAQERTLPYPMQLGGGSYSLLPTFTYKAQGSLGSFGLQAHADLPLHRNKRRLPHW